jgi:flavin reductase (DIM6/NTAB) family NADH-FMN oxidoreductase RutF
VSVASGIASALLDQTDRELWLVTAQTGTQRSGLIATYICNASLVPDLPRVLVGLAKQHHTRGLIEASDAFALHLLGEEHVGWVWRFGLCSGRDRDKFQGLATDTGATGSPLLAEALGWLDCRVEARLDTGDRTVYLGQVVQAELRRAAPPLTLKRLFQLAPPDKLEQEQELRRRDAAIDGAAIRAWRQRLGSGAGG